MAIMFWSLVIFGKIRGCACVLPLQANTENTQLTNISTAREGRPRRGESEQPLPSASLPTSPLAGRDASVATLPQYETPHDIPPAYGSTNEGGGCGRDHNDSGGRGHGPGGGGGGSRGGY